MIYAHATYAWMHVWHTFVYSVCLWLEVFVMFFIRWLTFLFLLREGRQSSFRFFQRPWCGGCPNAVGGAKAGGLLWRCARSSRRAGWLGKRVGLRSNTQVQSSKVKGPVINMTKEINVTKQLWRLLGCWKLVQCVNPCKRVKRLKYHVHSFTAHCVGLLFSCMMACHCFCLCRWATCIWSWAHPIQCCRVVFWGLWGESWFAASQSPNQSSKPKAKAI